MWKGLKLIVLISSPRVYCTLSSLFFIVLEKSPNFLSFLKICCFYRFGVGSYRYLIHHYVFNIRPSLSYLSKVSSGSLSLMLFSQPCWILPYSILTLNFYIFCVRIVSTNISLHDWIYKHLKEVLNHFVMVCYVLCFIILFGRVVVVVCLPLVNVIFLAFVPYACITKEYIMLQVL